MDQIVTVAGTVLVALLGCIGTWIVASKKSKTDRESQAATAQVTANDGLKFLIDQLQEERVQFAGEVLRLHSEMNKLNEQIRKLTLHIYSMERLLRKHGIELPIIPEMNIEP